MIRLLIKFWPVAVPLVLYLIWLVWAKQRARKQGNVVPKFLDGPWWWTVVATIIIGIIMFIILGLSEGHMQGTYEPAHMENGVLVPGKVSQ